MFKDYQAEENYTCPNDIEFEEMINKIDNFLTTQEDNMYNANYINETNA
ncbi:6398_t:CDS:1, partial [Cetraspora pellucida]